MSILINLCFVLITIPFQTGSYLKNFILFEYLYYNILVPKDQCHKRLVVTSVRWYNLKI